MGVSEPVHKQKDINEEETKRSKRLLEQLAKHNLLVSQKKGGKQLVDITKMNPEYSEYFTVAPKGNSVTFESFLQAYKNYRGQSDRNTPEKFVEKLYGPRNYGEAKISPGIGTEIPIRVQPSFGVENPQATGFLKLSKSEIKQDIITTEVGVATDDKLDAKQYVKGGYKGFFVESIDRFKEVMVGIGFGLVSIGRNLGGGEQGTIASAILGPWTGIYNFAAGAAKGAFSWVLYAAGMLGKIMERTFSEDEGMFRLEAKGKIEDLKGKATYKGTCNGAPADIYIEKVNKGIFNTTVIDASGKKYNVIEPYEGALRFYERRSFWRGFARVMHPGQMTIDSMDIIVVDPYLKIVNAVDGFRAPEQRKITNGEKRQCAKALAEALEKKNYETARRIAKLALYDGNTSGEERAMFKLKLDEAEWGLAHTGFFVGYMQGMGFGRKKPMVEKELESRINEELKILSEKRAEGKYNDERYLEAKTYILEKSRYRKTLTGRLVPISPSTAAVASAILAEKEKLEGEEKINMVGYRRPIEGKMDLRGIPLYEIRVQKGEKKEVAMQNWKNMMKILDRGYALAGKKNDEAAKETIERCYRLFTDPISGEANRNILYKGFSENLAKRNIDISKLDIDKLDDEKAFEYYIAMWGR
jgi:hypothetical protein